MIVFDDLVLWRPDGWQERARIAVEDGLLIAPPPGAPARSLHGALVTPGFVDLQVNGGGGLMLASCRSVDDLSRLVAAHRATGTTAIMPTLISEARGTIERIAGLVARYRADGGAGVLGLHLEGPHLARPGIHPPDRLRDIDARDRELYADIARKMPLLITLAPERASAADLDALARAGVTVALGHTDCSARAAADLFAAGRARMATHLFNAMGGLHHRDAGLALAALRHAPHIGLIADGTHVSADMLWLAHRAAADRLVLVSDAMAPAGTDADGFDLHGRAIARRDGRLTAPDGALAGADLTLARAIGVMAAATGRGRREIVRMAIDAPLRVLGDVPDLTAPGRRADLLVHTADRGVWVMAADGWARVRG